MLCLITLSHVQASSIILFFPHGATAPTGPGSSYYQGFTIALRDTTVGSTPLDE